MMRARAQSLQKTRKVNGCAHRHMQKKAPHQRGFRTGLFHRVQLEPPATAVNASWIAFGLGMIFMKLLLPIIFRSG